MEASGSGIMKGSTRAEAEAPVEGQFTTPWLAGMKAGVWPGMQEFAATWALDRQFEPTFDPSLRDAKHAGWKDAVSRVLTTRPAN